MEGYFDDSSDPRREEYYACGGLVGSQAQFDCLDLMWYQETRTLEKPFRSSDCECQQGQFEGWSKPDCDALMARLVGIIKHLRLHGIAAVVPIQDFKSVFPDLNPNEAFSVSVAHLIFNVANIAHIAYSDINLWFESGAHNAEIRRTYDSAKQLEWPPARLLSGLHIMDKSIRPLQAADLVAREAFKHIRNLGVRGTRKPILAMRDSLFFFLWTKAALNNLAQNGGPKNIWKVALNTYQRDDLKLYKHFWKNTWGLT